jgi:hypothetical protein
LLFRLKGLTLKNDPEIDWISTGLALDGTKENLPAREEPDQLMVKIVQRRGAQPPVAASNRKMGRHN